jgi:catechol 2,3-dioxygenase-like lactoylglutathione lyase family enzyme
MIKGLHVTVFTPQAEALRAFVRDKLGLKFSDAGGGWLIFDVAEAEVGVHEMEDSDSSTEGRNKGYQEISFYCDDIHQTVSELQGRGVEFTSDVVDQGWALTTQFLMPGDIDVMLYQPRYSKNHSS